MKLDKLKAKRAPAPAPAPAQAGSVAIESTVGQESTVETDTVLSDAKPSESRTPFSMNDLYLSKPNEDTAQLVDANNSNVELPSGIVLFCAKPSEFYVRPQVRSQISDIDIDDMADSLYENGQYQPIKVAPRETTGEYAGKYRVLIGGTRHAGAVKLEETGRDFKLWAIVDPSAPAWGSAELIIMQVRENTDRHDLPIYDKAIAVKKLIELGMSDKEIAEALGWFLKSSGEEKKPDYNQVGNFRHALSLPDEALELLRDGIIRDIVSAATLSKIYEIDAVKGSQLTQIISKSGISRDRLLNELRKSKAGPEVPEEKSQVVNAPKTKQVVVTDEAPKPVVNKEIPAEKLPRILVEWNLKSAELIFDPEIPSKQAKIKVAKTGDEITVDLSDLKIIKIEY